jgi:type II secretory pathway pseudopilin PulG
MRSRDRQMRTDARGATLLEVMFALALGATLTGLSVPVVSGTVDDMRAAMAARYVASRIGSTRIDAVRRSDIVALRFEPVGEDYMFATFGDGNSNGVRTAEIRAGVDPALGPFERLQDTFPGVRFALMPGVPDADGHAGTGEDGVRIGSSRLLSMSSDGTSSSGTLYIRGRRRQYAVRILGVTGRTRMLQYHAENRAWLTR